MSFVPDDFIVVLNDADFLKKTASFFRKFKKEFYYVKKYRVYISTDIDLQSSKFTRGRAITTEDLS